MSDAAERGECLEARADGEPVGFLILDRGFFGCHFVELLYVHAEWRRRGIGTALMRAAEQRCAGQKLFTSTNESNLPMQAACARWGFVLSGRVENLDDGDPELIYFKRASAG